MQAGGGGGEKGCTIADEPAGVIQICSGKDTCHVATRSLPLPFFSPLPHHDGYPYCSEKQTLACKYGTVPCRSPPIACRPLGWNLTATCVVA